MGSKPSGISGSRAAAVLNLSDYSTPLDVWKKIHEERTPGFCQAHGYDPPEELDTPPIKWGLGFEDAVIKLSEAEQSCEIVDQEKKFALNEYTTCHIDGRYKVFDPKCLHEGKTTNDFTFRKKWGEPGTNRIPTEYQIQVQHQMMCSGAKRAIVSVLVFPKMTDEWAEMGIEPTPELAARWAPVLAEMGYFHQYFIDRNVTLFEKMAKRYAEWWETYILEEVEPPAKTYDDIKAMVPEPKGTIVATDGVERLAAEYKAITSETGRVKKRKDEIKLMLLKYMKYHADAPVDEESVEKWILKSRDGKTLHWFDGERFR